MITVTGSLAFDYIMDYPGRFADNIMPDKIHNINLSFLLSDLKKQNGGTAGNIAYTLALLKTPVSIFATVGEDFNDYLLFLKGAGAITSGIKIIPGKKTASAFIMTDRMDNQITGFYPGAMSDSINYPLTDLEQKPDFVVISPNDPQAMINFCNQCQKLKVPYMLDPGMQLPALDPQDLKNMISGATFLIGNDYEMELLSVKCKVQSARLLEQVKILITTLGAEGSIIETAGNISPSRSQSPPGRWPKRLLYQIKAAKPLKVADPTGAGDAYRAGFLTGFTKGLDLKICGQMGSVAACYAVEKYGTTNHKFSISEFCERYKNNFGETLSLSS